MKKILLTLALAFCCAAGQGQTTAKPADVNIRRIFFIIETGFLQI